jgi:hypothetical protein
MKNLHDFRFPALLLTCTILIVLFTSYGNKKVHPDINTQIVYAFLSRNNKGDFSQSDFKKYLFNIEPGASIKGTAIVKDGLFSPGDMAASGFGYGYSDEGPAEMTPREWISHGGYSADVPEVPASLRHFYDPTRPEGEHYLTDITNARIMGTLQKYALTNPHTDGVEWALGTPGDHKIGVQDHQYTWERGKLWMQMALKEAQSDKKDEYMAKAWRALGETLHMIADNGCPPHVRNDAHPSPLWGNNNWFGNPDPYEELIDVIRRDTPGEFTSFFQGAPDPALKQTFQSARKARDIAHALAVFTNTNFVTTETISGTNQYGNPVKQITHPEYPYPAPLLEGLTYTESDYSYNSPLGVKECVDHYYFAKLIPKLCYPFVDMACVKSQARVLLPNIAEAGANVIRLFIPKFSVDILSIEKGVVKGEVRHKTDEEYTSEIRYTGEITLVVKDKSNRESDRIRAKATDGKFENSIKLAKGEKVIAQIAFGGVTVASNEFMGMDDNVFGIYQGPYELKINKENLLQMKISHINPATDEGGRQAAIYLCQREVEMFISNWKWVKGGAQGGPVAKIEIGKMKNMANYYIEKGLPYYVYALSNYSYLPKFLTPLKDKSNIGTTLTCSGAGFTSVVVTKDGTYTITGTFQGNNLNCTWDCSWKGKVLFSSSFTARKILDM